VAFLFFRPYRSQNTEQDGNVYLVRCLACQCAPLISSLVSFAHYDKAAKLSWLALCAGSAVFLGGLSIADQNAW
jgi:hypothetical protein